MGALTHSSAKLLSSYTCCGASTPPKPSCCVRVIPMRCRTSRDEIAVARDDLLFLHPVGCPQDGEFFGVGVRRIWTASPSDS
ncbi:hypothetical protein AVEN_246473-1 [Araneus ventricosus]|uniref:Uncharacterized protein n=2 Tax=Araneus ventricosus TaxID=182803 RepID=A0A4Y2WCG6_ARAVE|nr:hypothetical protein AVEN_246473-1 [Araneus ventricosus]